VEDHPEKQKRENKEKKVSIGLSYLEKEEKSF